MKTKKLALLAAALCLSISGFEAAASSMVSDGTTLYVIGNDGVIYVRELTPTTDEQDNITGFNHFERLEAQLPSGVRAVDMTLAVAQIVQYGMSMGTTVNLHVLGSDSHLYTCAFRNGDVTNWMPDADGQMDEDGSAVADWVDAPVVCFLASQLPSGVIPAH